jgi:hypothetical protein
MRPGKERVTDYGFNSYPLFDCLGWGNLTRRYQFLYLALKDFQHPLKPAPMFSIKPFD